MHGVGRARQRAETPNRMRRARVIESNACSRPRGNHAGKLDAAHPLGGAPRSPPLRGADSPLRPLPLPAPAQARRRRAADGQQEQKGHPAVAGGGGGAGVGEGGRRAAPAAAQPPPGRAEPGPGLAGGAEDGAQPAGRVHARGRRVPGQAGPHHVPHPGDGGFPLAARLPRHAAGGGAGGACPLLRASSGADPSQGDGPRVVARLSAAYVAQQPGPPVQPTAGMRPHLPLSCARAHPLRLQPPAQPSRWC